MIDSTRLTAGCAPACPVVWQGRAGERVSYADILILRMRQARARRCLGFDQLAMGIRGRAPAHRWSDPFERDLGRRRRALLYDSSSDWAFSRRIRVRSSLLRSLISRSMR